MLLRRCWSSCGRQDEVALDCAGGDWRALHGSGTVQRHGGIAVQRPRRLTLQLNDVIAGVTVNDVLLQFESINRRINAHHHHHHLIIITYVQCADIQQNQAIAPYKSQNAILSNY